MKAAARAIFLIISWGASRATETPAPPIAALRGIGAVNVEVQPLCSFAEFDAAAEVIKADVQKALVARGIKVTRSEHDDSHPTLEFAIHCEDIRWQHGKPLLGATPSEIPPEDPTAPFVYVVSARLFRNVSLPGKANAQSDAIVWYLDGRMRALSKRPFVALRDDILASTDSFIAEWEKARVTSGE